MRTEISLITMVLVALAGLFAIVAPQRIARLNLDAMERWPKEKRSEHTMQFWRSRSALLIVRGIGLGLVVWAVGAYATRG
jgi:hypothetical protein